MRCLQSQAPFGAVFLHSFIYWRKAAPSAACGPPRKVQFLELVVNTQALQLPVPDDKLEYILDVLGGIRARPQPPGGGLVVAGAARMYTSLSSGNENCRACVFTMSPSYAAPQRKRRPWLSAY